jgi:hypothetical protein
MSRDSNPRGNSNYQEIDLALLKRIPKEHWTQWQSDIIRVGELIEEIEGEKPKRRRTSKSRIGK